MHAVIKIVCFLIFGAAMATGAETMLLAGFVIVVGLYLVELFSGVFTQLGSAVKMLKRLRWLFLSILIVYLFFTPGVLIWPELLWGPTEQGLTQGLLRIVVLVLIVAAVNILIGSTGQVEFLSAVSWCLQPLSWVGLSHQRLAVRISLTLETVGVLRATIQNEPPDAHVTDTTADEPRLQNIANTAHRLFAKVIDDAEQAPLQTITLPEQTRPPVLQWFFPVLLATVLLAINFIVTDLG